MTRALGIAAAVTLGILAGCRGGPSAHVPTPEEPVGRASVPESDKGRLAPANAGASESHAVATTALPAFSATIWKREVISEEPVLLKLEVTNPGPDELRIVAPYFNTYGRMNLPLTLTVTDSAGQRVQNGWTDGGTGVEPILRGTPWWVPQSSTKGAKGPQAWRCWTIPGGETGYVWHNLRQYYPIDDPGEYHVVLHYQPDLDMVFYGDQADRALPADFSVWTGRVDMDVGVVRIAEPGPRDAEAANRLAEHRNVQGSVFSTTLAYADHAGILEGDISWLAGTVFQTYADFGRAFASHDPDSAAAPRGHDPSFPLWGLLGAARARATFTSGGAYSGLSKEHRELRAVPSRDPQLLAVAEAELRRNAEGASRRLEECSEAARETGDYSLLAWAEEKRVLTETRIKHDFPDWPN